MLTHYKERLKQKVAEAQRLSDEISALLREGATLDDPRIQRLTDQRAKVHDDLNEYQEAARQEQRPASARGEDHMQQTHDLETYDGVRRQPSGWRAPRTAETMTARRDGPTPFETFGQQMEAVVQAAQPGATTHKGLVELQQYQLGLGEGVPSEGGFLVQTDFTNDILSRMHQTGKLVARPRHIPISGRSNGLNINAIDEKSRVDGSRLGGLQGFWIAEGATITKSKPTFRQLGLKLKKLAALYYATDEELADVVALEETMATFVADELGFKLDDALIRGNGAGEPLGILGHAGTVSVAKEAAQVAKTIVIENIEKMFARLWARAADPIWLVNQDCWPQLFALSKAVGVGGVPVFLPAGGISGKPFQTLLGLPIISLEQCETIGTKGDIILADFASGYILIDKGGIRAEVSIHVEFLTDQSVFRFILRVDGQPINNAALTPFKGTDKVSSFITLDDRA